MGTSSSTVNVTTNSGTINTVNNTIVINNYGKEDIRHIIEDPVRMDRYIRRGIGGIPKMIEDIHADPLKPENRTLRSMGPNNAHIKLYSDGRWEVHRLDTIVDEQITTRASDLEDHVRSGESRVGPDGIRRFLEEAARATDGPECDPRCKKAVKREVMNVFLKTR